MISVNGYFIMFLAALFFTLCAGQASAYAVVLQQYGKPVGSLIVAMLFFLFVAGFFFWMTLPVFV